MIFQIMKSQLNTIYNNAIQYIVRNKKRFKYHKFQISYNKLYLFL